MEPKTVELSDGKVREMRERISEVLMANEVAWCGACGANETGEWCIACGASSSCASEVMADATRFAELTSEKTITTVLSGLKRDEMPTRITKAQLDKVMNEVVKILGA